GTWNAVRRWSKPSRRSTTRCSRRLPAARKRARTYLRSSPAGAKTVEDHLRCARDRSLGVVLHGPSQVLHPATHRHQHDRVPGSEPFALNGHPTTTPLLLI